MNSPFPTDFFCADKFMNVKRKERSYKENERLPDFIRAFKYRCGKNGMENARRKNNKQHCQYLIGRSFLLSLGRQQHPKEESLRCTGTDDDIDYFVYQRKNGYLQYCRGQTFESDFLPMNSNSEPITPAISSPTSSFIPKFNAALKPIIDQRAGITSK